MCIPESYCCTAKSGRKLNFNKKRKNIQFINFEHFLYELFTSFNLNIIKSYCR